ncbi:2339_t:CDS:1 [Dentiscutata heterogama]|uniref:2339_t:CDS:1 n=1 Tax=Dentiscutata heterogama TaxID=1316150 RepID=A0ACA9KMU9_9GLOM|nr:2339_t:CDS:1 [Dentiscutata heterogama]
MPQQSTDNTLKPVYNLVELELDNYEENKLVLDIIHDLNTFFQNSSICTCRRTPKQKDLRTCFEKVGFKCFFKRHFELKALEEQELELFIKLQLMSFELTDEKSDNKTLKKHTYKYNYNSSLPLCKPVYLKLCRINEYLLSTLQNHLQSNELTERVHRNTRHASKMESRVFLDFNITFAIKQFLVQYGAIHEFLSSLRHQDDSGIFIYLPTGQTYVSVYNEYKKSFYLTHDQSEKIISYFTFRRL